MKKVLIIIGGTALVGGVAWYFLTRKSGTTAPVSDAGSPRSKLTQEFIDKIQEHFDVIPDSIKTTVVNSTVATKAVKNDPDPIKTTVVNSTVATKAVKNDPLVKTTTPLNTGTTVVSPAASAKKEILDIAKQQKDRVSLMGVSAYNLF